MVDPKDTTECDTLLCQHRHTHHHHHHHHAQSNAHSCKIQYIDGIVEVACMDVPDADLILGNKYLNIGEPQAPATITSVLT